MAAMIPPPMIRTIRPFYMDNALDGASRSPSLSSNSHRSADSVSSSVNSQTDARYDAGAKYQYLRTLTPALEDDKEDRASLRSFAVSLTFRKPRWRIWQKLHRRSHTATESTVNFEILNPGPLSRQPSLNFGQLQRKNSSALLSGPRSPTFPTVVESPLELSSRRCYYSIARNCSGWVLGGQHGDACESCLRDGFFGSP